MNIFNEVPKGQLEILDVETRQDPEGVAYNVLIVTSGGTIEVSKFGNAYVKETRIAIMAGNRKKKALKKMIGEYIPGYIVKVKCEPFQMPNKEGELITYDERWRYFTPEGYEVHQAKLIAEAKAKGEAGEE